MTQSPYTLPPDLPAPIDDGACLHLRNRSLPAISLPTTAGESLFLPDLGGREHASGTVLFFYPRTGIPGQPASLGFRGETWDSIPGARGCTPQSCAYRDAFGEFRSLGVRIYGVSTNSSDHQREFTQRNHIPFDLLSDRNLDLVRALQLPTFEFPVESGGSNTLVRRMAWFVSPDAAGTPRIRKVWYPVFPPDANARTVLSWVARRTQITIRSATSADSAFISEELRQNWGGAEIWSLRRRYCADQLPALIATILGEPVGLLTYTPPTSAHDCEVITLSSRLEDRGVGSRLLQAAADLARAAGCPRIFLTTTNDNTRAIGFYQREGWDLIALHRGNVDDSRRHNPAIPLVGHLGIAIRDELELELPLSAR